jgi:predicted DNA-binding protein (UPF0251 family)
MLAFATDRRASRAAPHRRSADEMQRLDEALRCQPPPAELRYLAGRIGSLATILIVEARGGTRVKIPKHVNQGSELALVVGLEAARALSHWRGGETVKVPLAKLWRIRLYRAEGLSYTDIARRLCVGESTIHRYLQIAKMTNATAAADRRASEPPAERAKERASL